MKCELCGQELYFSGSTHKHECINARCPVLFRTSEVWRAVVGYEGLYEVSNHGKVRNASRRELSTPADGRGYAKVNLSKNKRKLQKSVHSLVAEAFLGPRPPGYDINHKNGIKTDNRVENLEYVTRQQNLRHAIAMGITPTGSRRRDAKLSSDDVREVRDRLSRGETHKSIAARFGVCREVVGLIYRGKTYKKESA